MKKILVLAPYCSLPGEKKFNRFLHIASELSKDYDVTLLTSKFRHFDKQLRSAVSFEGETFKIILINEPGYRQNISLSRLYSHSIFVRNFKQWIAKNEFDLIYSAYPLIGTNIVLSQLKRDRNFKLIIDVQDIWPEAIASVLPFIAKLPLKLLPFSSKANRAYASADALVAVSETYMKRAQLVNKTKLTNVLYIGSDDRQFSEASESRMLHSDLNLIYIGSLGHSYDVLTVAKAVKKLSVTGLNIKLHIFGAGGLETKIRALESNDIILHGFVAYGEMISWMKSSDVAVNSLVATAMQSVTNKLSDYLAVGLPILNSQKNPEVMSILSSHPSANYNPGDIDSCVKAILELAEKKHMLNGIRSEKLEFHRSRTYPELSNFVGKVLGDK